MIRYFNLRIMIFLACLILLMSFVVLEYCGLYVGLLIRKYLVIGLVVAFYLETL